MSVGFVPSNYRATAAAGSSAPPGCDRLRHRIDIDARVRFGRTGVMTRDGPSERCAFRYSRPGYDPDGDGSVGDATARRPWRGHYQDRVADRRYNPPGAAAEE